ncbi:uncharacterized protein PRCAT00004269001 [Priceomyces carsonii]|uniref:uncharacterized protein n=1 Tax=Priceomyces carsonii TaxID=28549 RepID=UPI002EDA1554|nr:unnamed protein product [Priceomyces carsonii]
MSVLSLSIEKAETSYIEEKTSVEDANVLSDAHKDYLIKTHGTLDLDPLPSMDANDPLNWSSSMKWTQLGMVAFHAFSTTFVASSIIPAFSALSEKFHVSLDSVSYLVSAQILVLGTLPFIWIPLMAKYGSRKPLTILTLLSLILNLGSIFANSYSSLMACRVLVALFLSSGIATGGAVVQQTSFSHQRSSRSGAWSVMISIGSVMGPFIMGFVTQRCDPKYIFVIFSVMNFIQFLSYVLLGKETLYNYEDSTRNNTDKFNQLFDFKAIMPEQKFGLKVILAPFQFLYRSLRVLFSGFTIGVAFSFSNIACVIMLPSIFTAKFHFGSQQIGLQYIAHLIGLLTGIFLSGWVSDKWMQYGKKQSKGPSFRLWLLYLGYILGAIGLIEYGVELQKITSWSVTPLIGIAITLCGHELINTTILTYAIDNNPERASDIATFCNFMRMLLAFVAPFYLPKMFESNLKYSGSFGLMAALLVISGIPAIIFHVLDRLKETKSQKEDV